MSRKLIPEFQDPKLTDSERTFDQEHQDVSLETIRGEHYKENKVEDALKKIRPAVVPSSESQETIFRIMVYIRRDTPVIYGSLKEFVLRGNPIPEGHVNSLVQQGVLHIDFKGKKKVDLNAIAFIESEQRRKTHD